MGNSKDLPPGFFYHPRSKFIYFKIKRWDHDKCKYVWGSPQSSGTEDIAEAVRMREELQKVADASGDIHRDMDHIYNLAYSAVNNILRWYGFDEITPKEAPRWSEAREQWLEDQRRQMESTARDVPHGKDPLKEVKTYISRIRQFDNWLEGVDPRITNITNRDAQHFYWDAVKTYQPSTVNATIKVLRRLFKDAIRDKLTQENPFIGIKTQGNDYRQKEPFSLDDMRKIWDNLDRLEHPEEWQTVVLFGLTLGARINDCTLRSWEEIDLNAPAHIIYSPGKTKKRRNRSKHDVEAPIVEPLYSHLLSLAGNHGGFITPNLAQLQTETLSNTFSGLLREIKIPMKIESGIKTWYSKGFHSWRHTLPSLMAAKGVSETIRMKVVGHTDKSTHHQYTHADRLQVREEVRRSLEDVEL